MLSYCVTPNFTNFYVCFVYSANDVIQMKNQFYGETHV